MAQPIHCDVHNRAHLADVMVTTIQTGEVFAACAAGYVEVARELVAGADQAATEAAEAEAQAEADQAAAEAEAKLEPETVIRRGTSKSRKAYEARRESHEANLGPSATPEADGAPGPSTAVQDDPGGEPAEPTDVVGLA